MWHDHTHPELASSLLTVKAQVLVGVQESLGDSLGDSLGESLGEAISPLRESEKQSPRMFGKFWLLARTTTALA